MDTKTGNYILDVFRDLNKNLGLTIVIVTHDRMLSKKVSRVVAIRDGKTSSEMIVKQSYADRLDSIGMFEEAHDEYAVLDKAGRVQIPREFLESLGVSGNKVRMEIEDGKVVISAPEEEPDKEPAGDGTGRQRAKQGRIRGTKEKAAPPGGKEPEEGA